MEFKINTSIPIRFEKIDNSEDSRFMEVKVEVAHTEKNLNNSYFSKELLEKMGEKLAGVPIVGFLAEDSSGETDFKGHEMKITVTEDGAEVTYLGSAFGCVLENNNARFEKKVCSDGSTKEYLVVDAILWRKFNTYTDIFEQDGFRWQSMELHPESIEGYFSEDKVFHFTDATVEALCALGKNVNPAMLEATIEKYSFASVQDQLRVLSKDLDNTDTITIRENDTKKGVFSIYSKKNVFNNNIEGKEDEVVPETKKTKTEIAAQFKLTSNQLEEELSRKLSEKKYKTTNWYGEEVEYSKYYLRDFDEQFVYAVDRQDNYKDVKMPYSKNGDDVTIDFEKVSRIKWTPTDWEGSDEDGEVSENFAVKILGEAKEQFDKAVSEKEEISAKYEKSAESLLKLQADFASLEQTVSEKDTLLQEKDQEINSLKEFKKQTLESERKSKVEQLFEKYKKNLSTEEVESFKEKESSFSTFEEFEREVKLFVADKVAETITSNSPQTPNVSFTQMGVPNSNTSDQQEEAKSVWDRLEKNKQ